MSEAPCQRGEPCVDCLEMLLDQRTDERDRLQRLFNRLEAAITHHKRDCEASDIPDTHDEALWAARDRVLRDSAEGRG